MLDMQINTVYQILIPAHAIMGCNVLYVKENPVKCFTESKVIEQVRAPPMCLQMVLNVKKKKHLNPIIKPQYFGYCMEIGV